MKIIKNRFIFFTISIIIILSGIVSMIYYPTVKKESALNYGIEFSGGTSLKVNFDKDKQVDKEELKQLIKEIIGSEHVQVQKIKNENAFDIIYGLPSGIKSLEKQETIKMQEENDKNLEVNNNDGINKPNSQPLAKEVTDEVNVENAEVVGDEIKVKDNQKDEKVENLSDDTSVSSNYYIIKIQSALKEKYGLTNDNFGKTEVNSATISSEMKVGAIVAIILATICILVYITYRFSDYKFGVSAVIALLHDVFIVLAVYAVLRIPVNNAFVAAMLTIVGYSINDTIVVFDRIRENSKLMKKNTKEELVDKSIKETFTRSINTSITTLLTITVLYILGTDVMKQFALPLIVGILAGTYSSIAIASPVWYQLNKK